MFLSFEWDIKHETGECLILVVSVLNSISIDRTVKSHLCWAVSLSKAH